MDKVSIKHYMHMLGCRKIKSTSLQVYSTCPNESEHSRGKDTRPGFTVKIEYSGKSPCFCPSCKLSMSFEWLVYKKLGIVTARNNEFDRKAFINAEIWGTPKHKDIFVPERLLEPFSGSVPRYALDRGLTIETCKAWGLGHDKENKRLIFPVRDGKNRLVGVSGRATFNSKIKYANYSWDTKNDKLVPFLDDEREEDFAHFKKSRFLYGEHILTRGTCVVVVEGQLDAIKVWQNGYDSVALMGSWVSDEQAFKLSDLCGRELVALFDNDKSGEEGVERLKKKLGAKVELKVATCVEGKDPGLMTMEETKGVIENVL